MSCLKVTALPGEGQLQIDNYGAWRNQGAVAMLVHPYAVPFAHLFVALMLFLTGPWLASQQPNYALHVLLPPLAYILHPLTLKAIVEMNSVAPIGLGLLLAAVYTASKRAIYRPAIVAGICVGTYAAVFESFHVWAIVMPIAILQRHQKLKKHIAPFRLICGRDVFGTCALSGIAIISGVLTFVFWQYLVHLHFSVQQPFWEYLKEYLISLWNFRHNNIEDYNLTWYLGALLFAGTRSLYAAYLNTVIVAQSVPLTFLWMRVPHLLVWIFLGILPLLERAVPGESLAFSMAVILIFGRLLLNHKLMIVTLLGANLTCWVAQDVFLSWLDYYSSNSNVAFIAAGGTTIALGLVWVHLYTDVHNYTFLENKSS